MRIVLFVLFVGTLTTLCWGSNAMATQDIWEDWPDCDYEAATYIKNNGLMLGYDDKIFNPHQPITARQLVRVLADRARLRSDISEDMFPHYPVTMKWVEENFLPNTVYTAAPDQYCTRFRLAVMLYRNQDRPSPQTNIWTEDYLIGVKLDQWFESTMTGGVRSRLVGQGQLMVQLSRQYNVPLWLVLGQCWRESQWFTTGLSKDHNMGWGMKDSKGRWGVVSYWEKGFACYTTIDEAVRAYFRLINGPTYRSLVDSQSWRQLLDVYAPAFENDCKQHYQIVMTVKKWCEDRGIL